MNFADTKHAPFLDLEFNIKFQSADHETVYTDTKQASFLDLEFTMKRLSVDHETRHKTSEFVDLQSTIKCMSAGRS